MTTPNSSKSPEEVNTQDKKTDEHIEALAYKGFVQEWIRKDGVKFVNKISKLESTDTTFKLDFMKYINSDSRFLELWDDFKTDMSLGKIKALLWPELNKIKNKRTNLKEYIVHTYDIHPDFYDKKILKSVNSLSYSEIDALIWDDRETSNFLVSAWLKNIQKREVRSFLDSMNIKARVEKISDPALKEKILSDIENNYMTINANSPLFVDKMSQFLSMLFAHDLINKTEQKTILKTFVPFVSLDDAKKLWLLNDRQVEDYIRKVVLEWVSSKEKDFMYDQIKKDLWDLSIRIENLIESPLWTSSKAMALIAEKVGFKKIATQARQLYLDEQENGPNDFTQLSKALALKEKVNGVDALKQGNIMEVEVSRDGQSVETEYYEIFSTHSSQDPKTSVSFQKKWANWVYLSKLESKLDIKSYKEFLEFADFENVKKINFVYKSVFEQKIASWEIQEEVGDFKYATWVEKDSRILRQKEALKKELVADGVMKEKDNIDTVIKNFTDEQKEQYKSFLETIESSQNYNTTLLRNELNKADKKWSKYGFQVGTTFEADGEKGNREHYTIEQIDENNWEWKVVVSLIWWKTIDLTFAHFLTSFQAAKWNRTSNINSVDSLLEWVNDEWNNWTGIEYKDWKLLDKTDPKNVFACDYLVSDEWDCFFWDYNLLKIHSMGWSTAEVHIWKVKSPWKENKNTIYQAEKDTITVSAWILASWIKRAWLSAKNINNQKDTKEELPEWNKNMHGSLWSKYFKNFASISVLGQAWKNYVEFYEQYFKEWRDEQVSRLVSRLPVLSDEQRSAAITSLENAEKKRMDEYLEKLKIRDSGEATQMIEKWLLNKDGLEAQKEAALFFMAEKYWVLYEKGALMKHKGTWLWYEALGWKIGDEGFLKRQAYCEKYGIQFTEEDLVYELIAGQCKWKLKPKRRGKLYKEFEATIWNWLESEIEKWKKDAAKKRTPEQREDFAIWEAKDGGWPNTFGAVDALIEKWFGWDIARLNCVPFVLMTSGSADSFAPGKADKFKGGMMPTQFFTGKQQHIDAYNNCVIQLAKDIEGKFWGDYVGMWKEIESLIRNKEWKNEDGKWWKLNEWERIARAYKIFYEKDGKWGNTLWRALLKLNTRKQDAESELETWISDHNDNPVYAEYEKLFDTGFEATKDVKFANKDVLNDGYKMSWKAGDGTWGMSGWDMYETFKQFVQPVSGGYGMRDKDLGMMFWKEATLQIDSLANNEHLDEGYKRKRIWDMLKWIMDAMSESYGQNEKSIWYITNNKGDIFHERFKQWWVREGDWDKADSNFRDGSFAKWDAIIDRYVNNILSWKQVLTSTTEHVDNFDTSWLNDIQNITKSKTEEQLRPADEVTE